MENVKEIKELHDTESVNEHLQDGWRLISVNTHYPRGFEKSMNQIHPLLVYVVGR